MKTQIGLLVLCTALSFSAPSIAAALDAQAVNTSSIASIPAEKPAGQAAEPDAAIVKLQALLDRAGASPGSIDGYFGDNLTKAIAAFEALNGLAVDGKLNPQVVQRLNDNIPVIQAYAIVPDDAKDLVQSIPSDYAKQAGMQHLGYTSVLEALSERFHMDPALVKALNPSAAFSPGETIAVAIPGQPLQGEVKRIEVRKKSGQVFALAVDGRLLAAYPATIGSEDTPSPTGTHKVKGVSRMPVYTYNPKINFQQGDNKKILKLPSGPNGPVGSVWIDLTEPTYGIHGTPEPEKIGKIGSHGCVRLTNWDAEELAGMVKPGVIVQFQDE